MVPLFGEFTVFLPVCGAQAEQRLQTVPTGLHILIVYVHVVQILLLLEDLLSGTCRCETDGSSTVSQVPAATFRQDSCSGSHAT